MPKGRKIREGEGTLYGYSEEEWKSFHKSKRARIRNPEKQKLAVKKWADKQPPGTHSKRARKARLKKMYSLTEEDYNSMLEMQNYKCAICGTDSPTGLWKVFAIDHCHSTGRVRGLLCNECNRGIGLLKDSAELLRKAADYLDNYTI